MTKQIGALLILLRRGKGLSQTEVAEQLCELSGLMTLTRHEVSRWERQVRFPSDFWLGWLSKVLGEPVAELEQARALSKGVETVAETNRPTKAKARERHQARSPRERSLATVSLTFEHQATCVQLSGTYEEPEQAWAAVRMFERMVAPGTTWAGGDGAAPVGAKPAGAAPNGKSPTPTPMGIRYTKMPEN